MFGSRPLIHSFVLSAEGSRRFPPVHDRIQIHSPELTGDPVKRRAMLTFLAALGTRYEDVILWGEPQDVELLVGRGYRADFRDGGLLIARFHGCPVTIRIPSAYPPAHDIVAEYGWDDVTPAANEFLIPRGTRPEQGEFRLDPRACLCGATWYRVALDRDDTGTASPGDRFCAGARPDGVVALRAGEKASESVCQLLP